MRVFAIRSFILPQSVDLFSNFPLIIRKYNPPLDFEHPKNPPENSQQTKSAIFRRSLQDQGTVGEYMGKGTHK
jgi:hypothetical protein